MTSLSSSVTIGLLLLVTAFELRGDRINIGPLSFYWTTARIAMLSFVVVSFHGFQRGAVRWLWTNERKAVVTSIIFFMVASLSVFLSDYVSVGMERLLFYGSFLYFFWWCFCLSYKNVLERVPLYLFYLGLILGVLGTLEFFSPNFNQY